MNRQHLNKQNQLHPPLPKKKRVDKLGNDRGRVFFKSGNSTMLLCRATENAARVISSHLQSICEQLHTKLEGTVFYTR